MLKIKYTRFVVVIFFLIPNFSFAYSSSSPGNSGNGTRINFGPVIGFYTVNARHAKSPIQKMSALIGFKRELRVDREYKTFFLFGIDYFFHGLNFKSYYFKPDSIQVYDKSFGYNYSLFIQELNMPLQVKYLFRRADNSLFSPYMAVGYHLRYLLPGTLRVDQNGNVVKKDSPELIFKNPFLNNKINSYVSISLGWQKNSLRAAKGSFFAELNYRYGFSPYYFQTNYSASSLYINGSHLSLQLGLKF